MLNFVFENTLTTDNIYDFLWLWRNYVKFWPKLIACRGSWDLRNMFAKFREVELSSEILRRAMRRSGNDFWKLCSMILSASKNVETSAFFKRSCYRCRLLRATTCLQSIRVRGLGIIFPLLTLFRLHHFLQPLLRTSIRPPSSFFLSPFESFVRPSGHLSRQNRRYYIVQRDVVCSDVVRYSDL